MVVMGIDGNQVDPLVRELVCDAAGAQVGDAGLCAGVDGHAPDFEIEIVVFVQGDVQAVAFCRALNGVRAASQKTVSGIGGEHNSACYGMLILM